MLRRRSPRCHNRPDRRGFAASSALSDVDARGRWDVWAHAAKLSLAATTAARGLQLADLDADGRLDVLVAEPAPSQLEAVLSTAAGLQQAGVYPLWRRRRRCIAIWMAIGTKNWRSLRAILIELWGERSCALGKLAAKPHFRNQSGCGLFLVGFRVGPHFLVLDAQPRASECDAGPIGNGLRVCLRDVGLPGWSAARRPGWLAQTADVDGMVNRTDLGGTKRACVGVCCPRWGCHAAD